MPKLFLLISLMILVSCSSDVEIYFPTDFVKKNNVILNEEYNLKDFVQEFDYSKIMTNRGEIQVSINGIISKLKTKNGGLLNLNMEEFVIFPVAYGKRHFAKMVMPHSVMVDSIIYYQSSNGFDEQFFRKYHLEDSDSSGFKLTNGMSSVKKDMLFREKTWNVGLNDDIPQQMEISQKNDDLNRGAGRLRVIRTADFFKLFAALSEEYLTINLKSDKSTIPKPVE